MDEHDSRKWQILFLVLVLVVVLVLESASHESLTPMRSGLNATVFAPRRNPMRSGEPPRRGKSSPRSKGRTEDDDEDEDEND